MHSEVLDLIGYAALINGNISVPVLSILPLPLVGNFEVFFTNLNTNVPDDACKPLHSYVPNLAGKIILVQRGTCPFDDKLYNVVAFGGTTVLFFDGLTSTTVLPYPQPDFTGVTVVGGLFRSDALAVSTSRLSLFCFADPPTFSSFSKCTRHNLQVDQL